MKRLFISLFAGVMFPAVVFFVVAFTSKRFLGPRPIPKFLIDFPGLAISQSGTTGLVPDPACSR